MVLAYDGMPQGFPGARHAHGQRQKAEGCSAVGIVFHDGLVAPDAGIVVHIPRLGHSDHRMNEEAGMKLLHGAESQFMMRPVYGIPGLKGDHALPARGRNMAPNLRGG